MKCYRGFPKLSNEKEIEKYMSEFSQREFVTQQERFTQRRRAKRPLYPFSALVGQDEMKLALLLNAVAPHIAGVLVRGEKGTAKSTAVRALQALLPEITVVTACVFGCNPTDTASLCQSCQERLEQEGALPEERRPVRLVELPLGATEDRVLGTLDLEQAIKDGVRSFEPGLLAAAHRGILYVDEVNLLPDHLVDALLDAAATGINVVEREGISFVHPASFLLIGTMNPEEGELRPQLLDRFGLSVDVHGLKDPLLRAEVVRRRIAFETDSPTLSAHWQEAEATMRAKIEAARRLLPQVVVSENILGLITHMCAELDIEGLRADITIYKASSALAALQRRTMVTEDDVQRVATMALPHRRRRQPYEQSKLDPQAIQDIINNYQPPRQEQHNAVSSPSQGANAPITSPTEEGGAQEQDPVPREKTTQTPRTDHNDVHDARDAQQSEQVISPGTPTALATLTPPRTRIQSHPTGKHTPVHLSQAPRTGSATFHPRGRIIAAKRPVRRPSALALAPTMRLAAPYQQRRRAEHALRDVHSFTQPTQRFWLERWDIMEPVRQHKQGTLILFAVDASGSMAARKRMAAAKGTVLTLLQYAYQQRNRVGLLQFRGETATLLLPPTNRISHAFEVLTRLPTGGRTPLASALRLAQRTLQAATADNEPQQMMLVLVTDGRANVIDTERGHDISTTPVEDAMTAARELRAMNITTLLIDTEEGSVRTGLASQLAQELGGSCIELATLETSSVVGAVRTVMKQIHTSPTNKGKTY